MLGCHPVPIARIAGMDHGAGRTWSSREPLLSQGRCQRKHVALSVDSPGMGRL